MSLQDMADLLLVTFWAEIRLKMAKCCPKCYICRRHIDIGRCKG